MFASAGRLGVFSNFEVQQETCLLSESAEQVEREEDTVVEEVAAERRALSPQVKVFGAETAVAVSVVEEELLLLVEVALSAPPPFFSLKALQIVFPIFICFVFLFLNYYFCCYFITFTFTFYFLIFSFHSRRRRTKRRRM